MSRRIQSNSLRKLFDDAERSVIPLDQLRPFKNHCFDQYEEGKLWNLADSIADNGLISPIIVRMLDTNMYEVLSGNNRVEAVRLLGKSDIECKIIEVDDASAAVIVLESNLEQRAFSELKLSNQIRVIAEYYNAIKQQGVRTDLVKEIEELTSGHSGQKLNARKAVSKKFNLSERKMARLIKMNALMDEFKNMLDLKTIKFMVGYEFSFLADVEQRMVLESVVDFKSLKKEQAVLIRKASEEGMLTSQCIKKILSQKHYRSNYQRRKVSEALSQYFQIELTDTQLDEIEKWLKNYIKNTSQ